MDGPLAHSCPFSYRFSHAIDSFHKLIDFRMRVIVNFLFFARTCVCQVAGRQAGKQSGIIWKKENFL